MQPLSSQSIRQVLGHVRMARPFFHWTGRGAAVRPFLPQRPPSGFFRTCTTSPSPSSSSCSTSSHPPVKMADEIKQKIATIFENNQKWVSAKKEGDAAFFDKLAAGQTPEYLYVAPPPPPRFRQWENPPRRSAVHMHTHTLSLSSVFLDLPLRNPTFLRDRRE